MKIEYQGKKYKLTGETTIFYVVELEEGNEQTIYIPKTEKVTVYEENLI